jgi:hypothetical protein
MTLDDFRNLGATSQLNAGVPDPHEEVVPPPSPNTAEVAAIRAVLRVNVVFVDIEMGNACPVEGGSSANG